MKKSAHIIWFNKIDKNDIKLVGGKGANLGEMVSFDIPVPKGFAISVQSYFEFLKENKLTEKIKQLYSQIDLSNPETLTQVSQEIKKLIFQQKVSPELAKEIIENYLKLGSLFHQAFVAIRSSATAEDLPSASFAGQQITFLNVRGEANVVEKVKECWASLFEPRSIFYRQEKGIEHLKVGISVLIQEMIPAEISGVMFTIDPVTNQKNRIVIEAIYGLGELLVQGIVTPDSYTVERNSLQILERNIQKQIVQFVKVGNLNKEIVVPKKIQLKRKLNDKQIVELAKIGKKIHNHYFYPQDIEWVIYKNKFYIVQTRPVTTIKKEKKKEVSDKLKRKSILTGQGASPGIGTGPVQIIKSAKEIKKIKNGDVLVTSMTTPDFVTAMKKVVAIITDKGGQTSHAAIVSRELGVPCVVGCLTATKILKNEQIVTVNGLVGTVYQGGIVSKASPLKDRFFASEKKDLPSPSPKTATKLYVNLGETTLAKEIATRNVDGVGLLRAEFMIAGIGYHPKQIIKYKKQKQFIDKIASNLAIFCKAFYPRPVIYRTTDFKTSEYRNLIGGKAYEPSEENPFIGYRGAFRYLSDPAVFEMELQAIKQVREKDNYNNLWLMIPFCRTVRELRQVKKIIVSQGLSRSPTFKLWLMVEIPANVVLLEKFIEVGIDGVSIGCNDLTMLMLGVDRDSTELANAFNENDPAVYWAVEKTIKTCQKLKISSSICGQAPSTYPDFVEKLVNWGITSISINPDVIEKTRLLIYEAEKKKATNGKNR